MRCSEPWIRVVTAVLAATALLALAELHLVATAATFGFGYAVAWATLVMLDEDVVEHASLDRSRASWHAGLFACALVGVPAAYAVSPSASFCVVVALAATSPPVVAWWGRLGPAQHGHEPSPDQVTGLLERGFTPEGVASLDGANLRRAWRRSDAMLAAASTVTEQLVVAHVRQLCLDELDRRHPDSLAAWLAAPDDGFGPEA